MYIYIFIQIHANVLYNEENINKKKLYIHHFLKLASKENATINLSRALIKFNIKLVKKNSFLF